MLCLQLYDSSSQSRVCQKCSSVKSICSEVSHLPVPFPEGLVPEGSIKAHRNASDPEHIGRACLILPTARDGFELPMTREYPLLVSLFHPDGLGPCRLRIADGRVAVRERDGDGVSLKPGNPPGRPQSTHSVYIFF